MQAIEQRVERQRLPQFVARAPEHLTAETGRPSQRRPHQGGLADAWLALNQRRAAPPCGQTRQEAGQHGKLLVPAEKHVRPRTAHRLGDLDVRGQNALDHTRDTSRHGRPVRPALLPARGPFGLDRAQQPAPFSLRQRLVPAPGSDPGLQVRHHRGQVALVLASGRHGLAI